MIRTVRILAAAALVCVLVPTSAQSQKGERRAAVTPVALSSPAKPAAVAPALPVPEAKPAAPLVTSITFADLGFSAGVRFSNLGGRREIFVPLPQGADLAASELVLALDDVSAHEAKRSLEILVNDRSAAAVALDGRSMGRQIRIPLAHTKGRDGFFKLGFVYSGAATQDRCIDVRYIGDSLTIRPESAVEIDIGSRTLDVATTAALMPHDVAVVLSSSRLGSADLAAGLTIGRSLKASGHRVTFVHGFDKLAELARRDDARRWSRGLIMVGSLQEVAPFIEAQPAHVAGPGGVSLGTLAAVTAGGLPAILVADTDLVRAGRLLASTLLPAVRGVAAASVGDVAGEKLPPDRVTFDELSLAPAVAEVFGRADITLAIPVRTLPPGTKPSRLALDLMVAPDGAGEKAVASVFVNERLLGSAVAAVGEPTRFDLALPDGLAGTVLNVRTVVQRRSAQGDCRFEPQGYPAQILGSSAVALAPADAEPHDFADLVAWWANGIEVWLPSPATERPGPSMTLVSDTLAALSPESAPIVVRFAGNGETPAPGLPFIAVGSRPPADSAPRVRFDLGRVTVADRGGRALLDLGGFNGGAVAQLVSSGGKPGLWIKPLAADGALPAPAEVRFDRGDIAFVDQSGVALAMSSERDTLVHVAYPDQVSWLTVAERFRPWIMGALWALVSIGFLFGLQRVLRRRGTAANDLTAMQPLSPSDRALGDLLVDRRVLTLPQLDEATALAEKWHVRLGDAIHSRNWVDSADYYRSLAQHYSLPFLDLATEPPDRALLTAADADIYAWTLTMPQARRGDGRLVIVTADPGPETVLYAREHWGTQIEFAVASKFDVSWAVQSAFAEALSERAVHGLAARDPGMSARQVFSLPQVVIAYGLLTAALMGLAVTPIATLIALNVMMSLFYLGNFLLKGVLVSVGGGRSLEADDAIAIAARQLTDEELPVYTVLVPMYREHRMLPMLAQALRDLDYPLGKLDIKLVLEADDHETIAAARALGLEGVFEVIRVPTSQPKTKPKACNYALGFARGEYLVIYDAEDRPEPDQLRKVVATFARAPKNTACLQCKLNYYNAADNWLTRMFTLDYSLWFDQVLPGLERLGIPIPLGGTSNHFKISVLRELHAWDPFNVTEDADLGIRMTQKGYRVGIVNSTTFEEASHEASTWIKQRSRWIKGYMQTFLVHTRRPLHLIRTTGLLGFFGFIFFIGGTALSGLLNPVFWLLYAVWLVALGSGFDPVFPQILLFLSLLNLLAGNGAFIYLSMLAPIHRGWLNLIPYSFTVIGYWVLMSAAAYRALWQLLRNPFYWEKTQHGGSRHVLQELKLARRRT